MGRKLKTEPIVAAERVQTFLRSRFNPIRNLEPSLLATYLDQFKLGFFSTIAQIWDTIEERDDTLASVVSKRKKSVARYGWEILPIDGADENEIEAHTEALTTFWNNITVTSAIDQNERGEVSLLVRQMMDAVGKRYAVHEIVWKPDGISITAEFRFAPLWFFENTTGKLRYISTQGSVYGVDMDPSAWLVTVGEGLMAASSIAWMYKNLTLKDWLIYSEKHGMPGIHGETDAQKDTPEWDNMVEAVENFANDYAMVTNTGAKINPIDISTKGALPFPPLVERMSRAMAALWRGADLSSMSAGAGDGSGASLQGGESELIEQDDAALISETLSRQVDRQVIEYLFGVGVKPAAYFRLKTSVKKNVDLDMKVDQFLINAGAPVGVKATLERYGRSLPDTDDETLKPAPVPAFGSSSLPVPNATRGAADHAVRPSIANEAAGTAIVLRASQANAKLAQNSLQQIAAAFAEDFKPLRDRIEYILGIPEQEYFFNALKNLQADLPKLLLEINADPRSAKALEDAFASSAINGWAEAAAKRQAVNQ